ncbi:hypothetical protein MGYG_07020 [Nannizzia gypsea CBS 118893]|uniref:Uncharacterized protein n=1 Tax=Arthroderma gypseum (strain ATCC MYA-4604 / CBS 118893) TaxID=535722 RepID=E4V1V0_ARTGP|nr:hypothetical protein MGYG_07020 [Nannizzia gypsea CBS 118893]EFR04015.1 hypothetical protein MGYG_07020 [Nannizzia gypsea CBS 118893]
MASEAIASILLAFWITLRVFGIVPKLEQIFDHLGIDRISDRIRTLKGWIQGPPKYDQQMEWIGNQNRNRTSRIYWMQYYLLITESIIEHAIQRKLDQMGKPYDIGPADWKRKLQDIVQSRAWTVSNMLYDLHLKKPEGPLIRQYERQQERITKALATNPAKHLSQPHLVETCKVRGGCCARACQCCLRARGLYHDKTIFYAHCTPICGCCVRNRGFVYLNKKGAMRFAGSADISNVTFTIEEKPYASAVL